MTSPDTNQSGSGYRLLVIAADTVTGAQLRDAVADRDQDREIEVRLIAPALAGSKLEHVMGDVDEARAVAAKRLESSTEELERAGLKVDGAIGDGDLKLAIQDALQTYPADEIVIVAHRDGGDVFETQWIEEAEREFETARKLGGDGYEDARRNLARCKSRRETLSASQLILTFGPKW